MVCMNDLSGKTFGRLTAIKRIGTNRHKKSVWLCACSCGNEAHALAGQLINGSKKSCGCLKIERTVSASKTHGLSKTPEYKILYAIINRCCNPLNSHWDYYGGRGVGVCHRWRFGDKEKSHIECFIEDMGKRPSKNHSIDRINNDGDYEPSNCRWSDSKQQSRNRTDNVFLTYSGKTLCLNDWSKEVGIERRTLAYRVKAGWPTEEVLTTSASYSNKFRKENKMVENKRIGAGSMMLNVVRKLARQRMLTGKSQSDVAVKVGVSRQAVTGWEDGRTMPSVENLFKWAAALEMEISVS